MFDSIDYIHTTDDNLNPDNTYDLNKFERLQDSKTVKMIEI